MLYNYMLNTKLDPRNSEKKPWGLQICIDTQRLPSIPLEHKRRKKTGSKHAANLLGRTKCSARTIIHVKLQLQVKELWILLTNTALLLFSKVFALKANCLVLANTTISLSKTPHHGADSQPIWANHIGTLLAKTISQADMNKMTFAQKNVELNLGSL